MSRGGAAVLRLLAGAPSGGAPASVNLRVDLVNKKKKRDCEGVRPDMGKRMEGVFGSGPCSCRRNRRKVAAAAVNSGERSWRPRGMKCVGDRGEWRRGSSGLYRSKEGRRSAQ